MCACVQKYEFFLVKVCVLGLICLICLYVLGLCVCKWRYKCVCMCRCKDNVCECVKLFCVCVCVHRDMNFFVKVCVLDWLGKVCLCCVCVRVC